MNKIHILSNRLPYQIEKDEEDFKLQPSVGGLATGMKSIYKKYNGKWIGWPGLSLDELNKKELQNVDKAFQKENCVPVHLTEDQINLYYEGFSNKTIWPLFHYFMQYISYDQKFWNAYVEVNQLFANAAIETIEDGDTIWIHDYQLLLVPEMIKSKRPNVTIGFFLHIPFPSFEVFRILPWRNELIKGILGADLIGFHTYDYERHFFSCVRRLLGHEINFNQIHLEDRIVMADTFPMGIDYQKFEKAAKNVLTKSLQEKSELHRDLDKYFLMDDGRRLIISIDRLDYTKGIPNRLKAFELFLETYPEYRGKVTLIMLAVPSRDQVDHYIQLKERVDQLVGKINGRFGMINYTPIWYFYRSLPFENLIELYSSCDVAMITPVRDGMNLVAKEYVASRINKSGVVLLSEMAGVSKEMGESIIINPNNFKEMAQGLYQALTMSREEQAERMELMQERLSRYDIFKWANDFVESLLKIQDIQNNFFAKKVSPSVVKSISKTYANSKSRVIFLDYDGTLAHFQNNPQAASPDKQVYSIIENLTKDKKNDVVIISGRDRDTLKKWFKGYDVNFIVEHGVWMKTLDSDWEMLTAINDDWKQFVRPALQSFVDRTPGAFIEEKNYSLVWHFRKAEPEQGVLRANELKDELTNLIANHNLEIMEGNKVIEVKTGGINKGVAAMNFISNKDYDFIFAIGDDWTDEYMFRELPEDTISVKVGMMKTEANFKVESVDKARALLESLYQ